MAIKNHDPLGLMVADTDDLRVVSAVMQDAVAKVGEMAYLPRARRFALLANRFVWEEGATKERGPWHRVRTGLHFEDVTRVRTRALDMGDKAAVVSILAIGFEPAGAEEGGEEGAGTITLSLGGGGAVALSVDAINAAAEDLSPPWRTQNKPDHALDGASDGEVA